MTQAFDIAIVLGAAVGPAGEALPPLRRRMTHAINLHRQGVARRLLLSGGGRGLVPEAEVMRALAMEAGVSVRDLIVECRSCNTFENAVYSLGVPAARCASQLLIVSEAYHLPRALFIFRRLGARVTGSAPVAPSTWVTYQGLLRETAALPLTLWRLAAYRAQITPTVAPAQRGPGKRDSCE